MFSQYLGKVVRVCYSHFVTMKTSSFQNREGDVSNDAQLKALKEYAKKNDLTLSKKHIYADEGIS